MFSCSALALEKRLTVEPKPTRRESFLFMVNKVIKDDYLPPSLVASLRGKFEFLCTRFVRQAIRCLFNLESPPVLSLKLTRTILTVSPHQDQSGSMMNDF